MNDLLRKLENIFEFYKSTLIINLVFCLLPFLFLGLFAFKFTFLTVGYVVSLLVKELNAKNEYLFYYNNTISKLELWAYAWFFNFVSLVFVSFVFNYLNALF